MLQVANRKLASLSDVLFTGLGRVLGFLRPLARGLIGSWRPPGWLRIAGAFVLFGLQWLQQRLAWLVLLALLVLAGWIASPHVLKWWHGLTPDRVEPVVATAKIEPPQRTQIELDKGPNPVVMNFSASVAPIARIGQEATGVAIEPAIAGRWTWAKQNRLEFQPAQDWPIGQPYKVQLAGNALAPHIEMELRKYEFTSPEFTAQIAAAEFYQDPVQANVRRALFQVRFSHPVNTAEFEKRLVLTYDQACSTSFFSVGKCASEKFTVSYDKLRLTATVQSEPLPMPEKTRPVVLSLTAGAVAQGRYLMVRIAKGLKSAGGYQLGATRDEIFRIKRSAPELAIMSRGSLLALSGEKKLPLLVRDLPGVKVEIGRLLPQQLQHLVTQSDGDMSKPEFYSGVTPDSLTERFERKIPLALKPGKTHYEALDFAEYLKADAGDRRGIFILTVQAYDPKDKSEGGETDKRREYYGEGDGECCEGEGEEPSEAVDLTRMRDRRLVIVTDLGIVSKLAVDGTRDVYVQSIHDGSPVAGASVEVWGKNGAVLVSKASDAAGVAHLPTLAGFTREKSPTVMVVRKGGDLSFLPLNRQDRNARSVTLRRRRPARERVAEPGTSLFVLGPRHLPSRRQHQCRHRRQVAGLEPETG
jgi:hypothetical protein